VNASTAMILSTCLLLISATAAASDSRIDFEVQLDARPVGTHSFDIKQAADGIYQIRSEAAFDVKFLGIVIYRYRHQATERWSQGCLTQIDSSTDDNGKRARVAKVLRDGCISSYAYWDPQRLLSQHELLNPQTGALDAVQIKPMGEEMLEVRGVPLRADRYQLRSSKLVIDLWYSKAGEWLQLVSTTESKQQLRYRLATTSR
jgi:Family of unknown function (DUF6134)